MVRLNLTACAIEYASLYNDNRTAFEKYAWHGRVVGIPQNSTTQISVQGCKELCGLDTQYYPWHQIADTITTWVLPSVGVVVQAPFESNRNWNNILCLARWIGSPIASLTAVLWNITVTGRCAMMVDMATSCQNDVDSSLADSNFADIRDSFYILSAMNQFSMMEHVRHADGKLSSEGLLRVALFSRDLELRKKLDDGSKRRTLKNLRSKTAHYLRAHRKRGVIPVFISTLWFIVAMAISIQSSFYSIGQNAAAHDLALGLLVAWLPLLMFATIVDRNFISTKDVRESLNKLVYETALALQSSNPQPVQDMANQEAPVGEQYNGSEPYHAYLKSLKAEFAEVSYKGMDGWDHDLKKLSEKCRALINSGELAYEGNKGFFRKFAGQGRIRRHYGAAHPILESIERAYIALQGRNWLLKDEPKARIHLVLKPRGQGLIWFDWRGLWQVLGSTLIVTFSVMGAFILSFCVPTIGLGCRSGGYTIFLTTAVLLQIMELVTWAVAVHYHRISKYLEDESRPDTAKRHAMIDSIFFSIFEIANAAWLINVIVEQTIGGFETCDCAASTWSKMGGYVDFTQYDISDVEATRLGWIIGTSLSCAILGLCMVWIFVQWCIQSHLSTEDIDQAKSGLKRTRIFLRFMRPFRVLPIGPVWTWQDGLQHSKQLDRDETPSSVTNIARGSSQPAVAEPGGKSPTDRVQAHHQPQLPRIGIVFQPDTLLEPSPGYIAGRRIPNRRSSESFLSPEDYEMATASIRSLSRTRSRSTSGSRSASPLLPT